MDDDVRRAAVSFIGSLERQVEAEAFTDDDAWVFIADLVEQFARPRKLLHAGQIAALRNFGQSIGIRPGGPEASYAPALAQAFGPCRVASADLRLLTRFFYEVVNGGGDFETVGRPQVQLDGAIQPPSRPKT